MTQKLADIGQEIRNQDNRGTDAPIFIVQQKRRIYGLTDDYSDQYDWFDGADELPTQDEQEKLDEIHLKDSAIIDGVQWRRVYYIDIWEFVTACFTEKGCEDYIAINGHNLNEPRIYADGSYRNAEFREVRKYLMSL